MLTVVVRIWVLIGVIGVFAPDSRAAQGEESGSADPQLRQRVAELEAQVRQLQKRVESRKEESGGIGDAAKAHSAAEIEAAIAAVAHDAQTRAPLEGTGGAIRTGWSDGRFRIASADGAYSLSPAILLQFRHVTNVRRGSGADDGSIEDGFENRRIKLFFDGSLGSPDLTYSFFWAVDRKTGQFVSEEAWLRYALTPAISIRAGQYMESVWQEQGVISRVQMAVDRSLLNELVSGPESFVQGVEAAYADAHFRANLGITDGYSSRNTNFQDYPANPYDFGVNGRVRFKAFGDWKDYADFTSLGIRQDLLVLSAGFDASQAGDSTTYRHGADVLWKTKHLSLYGGYLGRFEHGEDSDQYRWGLLGQAAYLFDAHWEAFVRADWSHLDDAAVNAGTRRDYEEFTVGLNYYFQAQHLKLTVDAGYLPNGSPANQDGIGVLGNTKAEFIGRAQLTLYL